MEETVVIGVRIPIKLKEMLEEYIRKDTHINVSDFLRTAIREKLQRDYPRLMQKIFTED